MASEDRAAHLGRLFQAMVDESEAIRLLREDPEALAKRFHLDPRDLQALRSADRLVITLRGEVTFETGSTFTARLGRAMTFETGTTITARRPGEVTFQTGTTITARGS
jgi:predicted flavoprotein YhiN